MIYDKWLNDLLNELFLWEKKSTTGHQEDNNPQF